MRLLHTADLHLGRSFNQFSLEEDHQVILDQILQTLTDHAVDVLIIAGDIFDVAAPSAGTVAQFNAFLSRVAIETKAAIVMIAGNHDSNDRIAAMSVLADRKRALIRGSLTADEKPLILEDGHGPVAFSGLPFSYEYAARECFSDPAIKSPQDVLTAQTASARANLPQGARWVIVAHAFVAGGQGSEGERPLVRVGGIETVSPSTFDGAHYVALGHLHRAQSAGADHIRYSGSPLAFGFDEAGAQKSMTLVDLDGTGNVSVSQIPFTPLRQVRVLKESFANLLVHEPSLDFVQAILTDKTRLIDPIKRLREVFPNALMKYETLEHGPWESVGHVKDTLTTQPIDVISDFLNQIRGEGPAEDERHLIEAALHEIRAQEHRE